MAENKSSFVLYADYLATVSKLTDAKAGKLFKLILEYVNDKNPETDDLIIQLAFEPVRQHLKRDLKKWEREKVDRSTSGKLGNLKRWNIEVYNKVMSEELSLEEGIKIAKHRPAIKGVANIAVNVNDSVSVNDSVIKRERAFAPPSKEQVIDFMSKKLDDFTAMAEADKFINFYDSKNWFIGKNKMKKWEAAAAGWISRMKNFNHGTHQQTSTGSKAGTSEARTDAIKRW